MCNEKIVMYSLTVVSVVRGVTEEIVSPCMRICCLQPLNALLSFMHLNVSDSVAGGPAEMVGRVILDTEEVVFPGVSGRLGSLVNLCTSLSGNGS